MASYREGRPTGFTRSRAAGSTLLGSRAAAAALASRHVNSVRRYCEPVACDVGTRALLYDLDAVCARFRARRASAA